MGRDTEYLKKRNLLETYPSELPAMGNSVADPTRLLFDPLTGRLPQEHLQCWFVADRSIDRLWEYKGRRPSHYKSSEISVGPVTMPDFPNHDWAVESIDLTANIWVITRPIMAK